MGYAIAGLYFVIFALFTPMLHQLFNLTNRVTRIEDKMDNLITEVKQISGTIEAKAEKKELEEVERRVEVLEKKLAGRAA